MAHSAADEARAPRRAVLVAEDEPSIRESLVELFGAEANVVAAATLADALTALREHLFALVISDLRLGNKPDAGFQIMASAGLLCPDAHVIALTAYPSLATRAAAGRLGATHFLVKPADLERLARLAADAGVGSTLQRGGKRGNLRL